MKYCPNCAGMDIGKNTNGIDQCKRCNFVGEMKEGSMDEINAARRRFMTVSRSGTATENTPSAPTIPTNKELREKLDKLKEKKTQDLKSI